MTTCRGVIRALVGGLAGSLVMGALLTGAAAQPADPATPPAATEAAEPRDKEKDRALEKYAKGQEAFQDHRFRDAIDLFLAGDRIIQNASFAFNIGLSYEHMGDSARALEWFREYARREPSAEDRAKVMARVIRHELKLQAKGIQQVTVRSKPAGGTVTIDGRPVGVSPWTGELPPGSHEVRVRLDGYRDATSQFVLAPERSMDVISVLAKEEAAAPAPAAPTATPAPDRPSPPTDDDTEAGTVQPWTWIALGLGVGGLGAAVGLELARAGADDDALGAETQIDALDHHDKATNLEMGAQIATVAGGALLVLGGVLLWVDLSSGDEPADDETAPTARAGLGCHGSGCGLGVAGSF